MLCWVLCVQIKHVVKLKTHHSLKVSEFELLTEDKVQLQIQFLDSGPNDAETQSSRVTLKTLKGHSYTEFKSLQLPSSYSELKGPLGWEVRRLQETETSPIAYDTALRITTTWMTENPHQQFLDKWNFRFRASFLQPGSLSSVAKETWIHFWRTVPQ